MTNVDTLLLNIVNFNSPPIEEQIPKRDSKVLRSLALAASSTNFITENQGKLAVKILREHQAKIVDFASELKEALESPTWSRHFRQIDRTKKLYISTVDDNLFITIEFAFSSAIRKIIGNANRNIYGLVQVAPGKLYRAPLTEQNVVTLVDTFSKLEFDIEEKIQDYYKTIKSWSESEIVDQYRIDTITHTNFQKHISDDLGINTSIDQNIIIDRSVRYQYFHEKPKKLPENLTEKIAMRRSTKLWISKKDTSLVDIIKSLLLLRRAPILFVFDANDPKKCLEDLENLTKSLEENEIFENIGIYFRLDNNGLGKDFNQLIATKKFNAPLDNKTVVAGISNGKIPKFLLKSDWKPMSVVSISKTLHYNKTAVYTNCCDLIINWTDNEPFTEEIQLWS